MRIQIHQIRINLFFQTFHTHGVRRISHSCQHLQCYKYQMMEKFLSFLRFKAKGYTYNGCQRPSVSTFGTKTVSSCDSFFPRNHLKKYNTKCIYITLVCSHPIPQISTEGCTMSSKNSSRHSIWIKLVDIHLLGSKVTKCSYNCSCWCFSIIGFPNKFWQAKIWNLNSRESIWDSQ